jgi:hypothetical protein
MRIEFGNSEYDAKIAALGKFTVEDRNSGNVVVT